MATTSNASFRGAVHPVGILAGMGPAAGVDFARLFLQACEAVLIAHQVPVSDQAYPEHWLVQVPVVDRTRALFDRDAPSPLPQMTRMLAQFASLGVRAAAVACNTAHAWHEQLAETQPDIELLHIARETVARMRRDGVGRAILLATQGTYRMGLYDDAFAQANIECLLPDETEREALMQGIYQGVKAGKLTLARERFVWAAQRLRARYGDVPLVMACTEIPLALPQSEQVRGWTLYDPAAIVASALARRAYGLKP